MRDKDCGVQANGLVTNSPVTHVMGERAGFEFVDKIYSTN